jgi:TPR repeat protein
MRISEFWSHRVFVLALVGSLSATAAWGFDRRSAEVSGSSPWDVFRFGFSAYQKGEKDEAVEAYRYAAEQGHHGALWKLGRMYAEGDGVGRNDYQAYRFFEQIVNSGAENGSPDESYVSDALFYLAGYVKSGIAGSPVRANPDLSRDLYMRGATLYGDSRAQFEIGRSYLEGNAGKLAANVQQAARWMRLAAAKGHAGAQAMLGDILFQSGNSVRGLAMMTAALQRATVADRQWIQRMQENAFALSAESERRTAIALADNLLKDGR